VAVEPSVDVEEARAQARRSFLLGLLNPLWLLVAPLALSGALPWWRWLYIGLIPTILYGLIRRTRRYRRQIEAIGPQRVAPRTP